jgi:hypothetical protein
MALLPSTNDYGATDPLGIRLGGNDRKTEVAVAGT